MNKIVLSMALLRFFSAACECSAGLLFLFYNQPSVALRINSYLGLLGPCIFVGVSLLGLSEIATSLPISRLLSIIMGIILIVYGTSA